MVAISNVYLFNLKEIIKNSLKGFKIMMRITNDI